MPIVLILRVKRNKSNTAIIFILLTLNELHDAKIKHELNIIWDLMFSMFNGIQCFNAERSCQISMLNFGVIPPAEKI